MMTKYLLVAALLLMVVAGSGCIIIDADDDFACEPATVELETTTVQQSDTAGRPDFEDGSRQAPAATAERRA